jgi:mannosylglycoprotein endo-beta-mannosidase
VAHELVHSVHTSGRPGIILKLDYEKAYDRVSWTFLFDMLTARGFDPVWINWIKHIVIGGYLGILVNGEDSAYFKTGKGLRQGDPLSPLLFNLVGDALSRMLKRATNRGLIKGLLEDFRPGGIVSLQYADDTVLFSSAEESVVENLKCVLMWYEQVPGMRINFHKSELVPLNLEATKAQRLAHICSCPVGKFPLKYLGVPLHYENLTREDVQPLVDKIMKRVAGWKGSLLSLAARVVLIKSCLTSIPIYLLSFIKFPKWAIKLLNTHMSNFLWNDLENNHKYHLANWDMVSMCKDYGGLGIPNLRDLNISLLASWLKRYKSDKDKLWKELVDFKYQTKDPNILVTRTTNSSSFFKGFMWATQAAKLGYKWKVGNGKKIRLWEDNWLGSTSLAIQFWPIYRILYEQGKTIAELWDGTNLKCTFRRNFSEALYQSWLEIVELVSTIELTEEEDEMVWQYTSKGTYSSQSLYKIKISEGLNKCMFLQFGALRSLLEYICFCGFSLIIEP